MYKAWTLEILLFLLYFSFGISWLAYSPMLALIETKFAVSHTEAAGLISTVSLAKAFVPMLAGLLAARIGLYRSILIGAALAALAPFIPYVSDFKAMLLLRFLFGIGGAMLVTLTGAVVMQHFTREQMPLITGVNNVAVNTGITTALLVTLPVVKAFGGNGEDALAQGWQRGLSSLGILSLVLAVLWGLLGRDASVPSVDNAINLGDPAKDAPKSASLGAIIRMKETWLIALAFTGPLCLYLSFNTWLPRHYMAAYGFTAATAASITSLFNFVGIPTAFIASYVAKRLGLRRPLIILAGIVMPISALGLILGPNVPFMTVAAVFFGMSLFTYTAPLFTIPMELPGANSNQVALMNGVVYSGAYVLASAAPSVVGKMADVTGQYQMGLCIFAVFSSVLAISGFLLPETGPRATSSVKVDLMPIGSVHDEE